MMMVRKIVVIMMKLMMMKRTKRMRRILPRCMIAVMAASRRCMKPRATLSPDSPPTHRSAQTWAQGTLEGKSLETFEGGLSRVA